MRSSVFACTAFSVESRAAQVSVAAAENRTPPDITLTPTTAAPDRFMNSRRSGLGVPMCPSSFMELPHLSFHDRLVVCHRRLLRCREVKCRIATRTCPDDRRTVAPRSTQRGSTSLLPRHAITRTRTRPRSAGRAPCGSR